MIKTGGENVASREVEEAIYRLPQVSEVAVIGLPDPKWIEAVSAVVVVKHGQTLDASALVGHCREHLAAFKVPKRVFFCETLPKYPSGKILKRQLRQQYQSSGSAAATNVRLGGVSMRERAATERPPPRLRDRPTRWSADAEPS